jgi:hypothetical protein
MIPLLLSFTWLEAFLPTLNHCFCKHEKPEYHTTNDDQIDERKDMKADRARREDGRTAIQWRKIHQKNTSKSLATKQCIGGEALRLNPLFYLGIHS